MTFDNLSSINDLNEGDVVFFRRLGSRKLESAKVIEIADMHPEPLCYLSNGMVVEKSSLKFFRQNVKRVHPYQRGRTSITGLGL